MSTPSQIKVYSRYNPPPSVGYACKSASMTRQEFADECDLNKIMERYSKGLAPLPTGARMPQYGDFSGVPDYQTMLNQVIEVQEQFGRLPSDVRRRFDNDPAKLIDFLNDDKNLEEAVRLGLCEAKREPKRDDASNQPKNGPTSVSSADPVSDLSKSDGGQK